MIADWLPLRLLWRAGSGGMARSRDVVMMLVEAPVLGFSYTELDFAPGACALVRRRAWDAIDDLLPSEVAACLAFLAAMDADPPDLEPDC